MDKGQHNGIICLLCLTAFLFILKMHKTAPTDITEFGLWIAGLGALRYGYIFINNEIDFFLTKRKLIKNGKKYNQKKNKGTQK